MNMDEHGEYGEFPLPGEDRPYVEPLQDSPHFIVTFDAVVEEKSLSYEEACRCLGLLGKDESGVRYAYLSIKAVDRKLTEVSTILNFKHVLFLDLSGNLLNLEALQVLAQMPFLLWLTANRNRVESGALQEMPYLQVLCLSANKIEETCDIAQPMLEKLELEYNQIFTVQFAGDKLPNLKTLDLKGNHLMDLSGTYPKSLEHLYLAKNKITKLQDLALTPNFSNLTVLFLRDNKIRKLNGFTKYLTKLTYLNLRGNSITKMRQFRKLDCLPNLETLIYTENPVDKKKGEERRGEDDDEDLEEEFGEDGPIKKQDPWDPVRIGVLVLLPKLKRINKIPVSLEERDEAVFIKDIKITQIMLEDSSDEETEPPTTTTYSSEADVTETELGQSSVFDPRKDETTDEEDEEEI
ncbi:unnamed protein product [Ceutorhynchus assimilis]|uniref:Leucine-rich repeat-containing protein 23 n=1 Tax=Ceutorhynchus assimilis TaxID=467358 RepID=A0A9N9QE67_9CUCU|nr:unnamed protein product [Ceutorhynchus assimilis]